MSSATDHSDKSFWLATYGLYSSNPAVQGNLKVDVAIIGGIEWIDAHRVA